jgi:hypothetical protein
MNRTKLLLTACVAVGLVAPHGWAQPPAPEKPPVDLTKKTVVEKDTSRVVQGSAEIERAVAALRAAQPDANNPTVAPGKVKWHKTLADAQAASAKSGKPVLLFHMMGQLDKQFC